MDIKLDISQKLTLSHNMMLSAEILQMSSIELVDYIKELSVENPVLEYELKREEGAEDEAAALKSKLEWLDGSDEQNRIYYNQDSDDKNSDMWNFDGSKGESLEENLLGQLSVLNLKREVYILSKYIIQNMDRNGYVKETKEDLYDIFKPFKKIKNEYIDEAFKLVQSFEPAGVGAADLKECLLLQMARKEVKDEFTEAVIKNHLEDVAKNRLPAIAKDMRTDIEQVQRAVLVIKKLNPRPGNSFSSDEASSYVVPDIALEQDGDDFKITLSDKYFPIVRVNRQYSSMLDMDISDAAREYVASKLRQATWAMKCIEKRNQTLTETMRVIADIQREFFLEKSGSIKPMKLADVAARVGIHESTVSRAVRNKYVQCCRGVFALSYFFCGGLGGGAGDSAKSSPDSIKAKLKRIIDNEDSKCPLSDRALTELLNAEGVEISRRTVAKYRESMGIGAASMRKSF